MTSMNAELSLYKRIREVIENNFDYLQEKGVIKFIDNIVDICKAHIKVELDQSMEPAVEALVRKMAGQIINAKYGKTFNFSLN